MLYVFSPGTFGKEDENPVDSFCFVRMSVSTTLFHWLSVTNSFDHQGVGGLLLRRWRCRCSGKIVAVTSGRLKIFPPSMCISSDPQEFRPNVGIFASLPTDFAPKFQLPFLGVLLHNFTFGVVPLGTRFHISTIGDWGCLTNQPSAAETNCWWGKWWVDNYQKKGCSVFRCVTIALSE